MSKQHQRTPQKKVSEETKYKNEIEQMQKDIKKDVPAVRIELLKKDISDHCKQMKQKAVEETITFKNEKKMYVSEIEIKEQLDVDIIEQSFREMEEMYKSKEAMVQQSHQTFMTEKNEELENIGKMEQEIEDFYAEEFDELDIELKELEKKIAKVKQQADE